MKVLLLILSAVAIGTWNFIPKQTVKVDFTQIELDNLGNIYGISDKGALYKLTPKGDTLFTLEDKTVNITFVQAKNPLKIMGFDPNQNAVIFLDKTLTAQGKSISLDQINIQNTHAVGMSRDNNFWVFDPIDQSLKKYTPSLKQVSNSGPVNTILQTNFEPYIIQEEVEKVYVVDSTKGLLEFDFFGNYLGFTPIKIQSEFSLTNKHLIYLQNDSLAFYDLLFHETEKIALPDQNILDFEIYQNKLYLLSAKNLNIYEINF